MAFSDFHLLDRLEPLTNFSYLALKILEKRYFLLTYQVVGMRIKEM